MVLSKKIEVRTSKIAGHGLYCKERIEVGEMVSEDLRATSLQQLCAPNSVTILQDAANSGVVHRMVRCINTEHQ